MTVTEESGGRLNAFAKEPEIEIISKDASIGRRLQLLVLVGSIFLIGIFWASYIIK